MAFTRTIENFTCEHCSASVVGNGYTNHCPQCLWSKHVDVDPGDRASACSGMMAPVSIEGATGTGYRIRHRCERCGFERMIDAREEDSHSAILALAGTRGL